MKKASLIFFLLMNYKTASAQNYIDLMKVDYAVTPTTGFKNSTTSTHLQEVNGELTVPVQIKDQCTFLTGLMYEYNSASFNPGRKTESVSGITLKLGANIKHNSNWSGTYMLLPKISSDLKKLTHQDFQVGGIVLMQYTRSTHLNYKFGVYSNSDLFGPFIVPLLGFYYLNSNERLEVKALLPLGADVNYSIANGARLGLNFKGQVRSYNLNTPIAAEQNRYLAKSTNDIYAYFQYGLTNGLHFQLAVGHSLARSYRIYDEKVSFGMPLLYFGDTRTQLNTDFSDSWLLKFSVFYRLKINH